MPSLGRWLKTCVFVLALTPVAVIVAADFKPAYSTPVLDQIETVAGGGAGDEGSRLAAALIPWDLTLGSDGALIVADLAMCRIRQIHGTTVSTLAGNGACGVGPLSGTAMTSLAGPSGVDVAPNGDIYFTDQDGYLRRIARGQIQAIAGAVLNVGKVAIDSGGEVYVADTQHCRIWRLNGATLIAFAGTGECGFSGDAGPALTAKVNTPKGVAFDASNNMYFADAGNCRVRRIDALTGVITTIAGGGGCAFLGDGGSATASLLAEPKDVAFDESSGDLLIADACRIRKVTNGVIDTVVGSGVCGYSGDGGPAAAAQIVPEAIVIAPSGELYIAERANCRIRKVAIGLIDTYAGSGECGLYGDGGPATAASLFPEGVTIHSGQLIVADRGNCRVRKVSEGGIITTIAGGGGSGLPGSGPDCTYAGDGGPATSASLNPWDVVADSLGNVYIADRGNHRVRRVDASTGEIMTVAGNGALCSGGDGGPATEACVSQPNSLAISATDDLYIAESGYQCRVRKVSAGIISTVAGTGGCHSYSGDGGPATQAGLAGVWGIALDQAGDLYLSDFFSGSNGCRIRKVFADSGIIITVAGNETCGYVADGVPATSTSLSYPQGVAVDSEGTLWIADSGSCRLRKVISGIISTVLGGGCAYSGDGCFAAPDIAGLSEVFVDSSDNVYVSGRPTNSSLSDNRVRKLSNVPDADVDGFRDCPALVHQGPQNTDSGRDNCLGLNNTTQLNSDGNFIDATPPPPVDDSSRAMSDAMGDACDADDDNDGLTDADELALPGAGCPAASGALTPLNPDTDGDGAIDGAECVIGTNPNDPLSKPTAGDCRVLSGAPALSTDVDTDGDVIVDRVEVCGYGTSPTLVDSDDDGWHDGCEVASINANSGTPVVNSGDQLQLASAMLLDLFGPSVLAADLNKDGGNNSGDQLLMAQVMLAGGLQALFCELP